MIRLALLIWFRFDDRSWVTGSSTAAHLPVVLSLTYLRYTKIRAWCSVVLLGGKECLVLVFFVGPGFFNFSFNYTNLPSYIFAHSQQPDYIYRNIIE